MLSYWNGVSMDSYSILNIVMAKVWGGGEQYVYDASKALVSNGNEVYIASDGRNKLLATKYKEIAKVIECNLYSMSGIMSILILFKNIKRNHIQFVQCHSGHAVLLGMALKMLTGVKLIIFKHNALPSKHDCYHKWQRKYVDAYVCVSQLVYDLQIKGLSKNEEKKFHLVYNGIDISKFNNSIVEKKEQFCIGYAGRITENKGLEVLLKAFYGFVQLYPDTKLLIAGSGDKNFLTKLHIYINANGLNDKVEFLGHVNDMDDFYHSIDVFVLPSIVREAFGLVLCEAMYCGLPVITTDSGAQCEIISEGVNGYIVKRNNVHELLKAIIRVYINPELRKEIAENAKKKVESSFTMTHYLYSISKLYDSLR